MEQSLRWTPCIVKKTLETIINSCNDYLICVKKNQKKLYEKIEYLTKEWRQNLGYLKTEETNRGREEVRKLYVYEVTEEIKKEWKGSKRIIKLVREREEKGKTERKTWYYICSKVLAKKNIMKEYEAIGI